MMLPEIVPIAVGKRRPRCRGDVLEALIKLHVQGELAVLAPVNGLGTGTCLDLVGRKGRLEETASGIDLDVSGAGRAAAAEKAHATDLDLGRGRATGGSSSGKADNGHKGVDELDFRQLDLKNVGERVGVVQYVSV